MQRKVLQATQPCSRLSSADGAIFQSKGAGRTFGARGDFIWQSSTHPNAISCLRRISLNPRSEHILRKMRPTLGTRMLDPVRQSRPDACPRRRKPRSIRRLTPNLPKMTGAAFPVGARLQLVVMPSQTVLVPWLLEGERPLSSRCQLRLIASHAQKPIWNPTARYQLLEGMLRADATPAPRHRSRSGAEGAAANDSRRSRDAGLRCCPR
jgi:hypothetical protein